MHILLGLWKSNPGKLIPWLFITEFVIRWPKTRNAWKQEKPVLVLFFPSKESHLSCFFPYCKLLNGVAGHNPIKLTNIFHNFKIIGKCVYNTCKCFSHQERGKLIAEKSFFSAILQYYYIYWIDTWPTKYFPIYSWPDLRYLYVFGI